MIIASLIEKKLAKIKFIDEQIANKKPHDISKEYDKQRRIELESELEGICEVKRVLERWFDLEKISTHTPE